MMHISGTSAPLPFHAPDQRCCNCGTEHGVHMRDTELKKTTYMLLGGTETTFVLGLPFCGDCEPTAARFRQGYFSRALVAFVLFWVLLGVLMGAGGEHPPAWLVENMMLIAALGAVGLTTAFYLLRRPSAPQTSAYQPVFLSKLKRSFKGEVQRLDLGFTNHAYADQFALQNQAYCQSGLLVVDKR